MRTVTPNEEKMIVYILVAVAWSFSSILLVMGLAFAITSEPPSEKAREFYERVKKRWFLSGFVSSFSWWSSPRLRSMWRSQANPVKRHRTWKDG